MPPTRLAKYENEDHETCGTHGARTQPCTDMHREKVHGVASAVCAALHEAGDEATTAAARVSEKKSCSAASRGGYEGAGSRGRAAEPAAGPPALRDGVVAPGPAMSRCPPIRESFSLSV